MPVKRARNADETREILTDRKALKELMSDEDGLLNWVNESVQERIKHDPEITAQLQAQAHSAALSFLRDGEGKSEVVKRLNLDNAYNRDGSKVRKNLIYNKSAIGAKHDDSFSSLAELNVAISDHAFKDAELSRKLAGLKNDLSSIKPSDGGFLIPEVLRAEIMRVAHERAVVRSRARVIPMDSLTVAFPTVDETSHVSSVYGGITGFWTGEGATLTESQPRFGQIELRAHKLTLYTEVPNELLRDARPALTEFMEGVFPEALAWFEDVAFFVGGGVGEPLGFLNADATIEIDRAGSSTDTVAWVDIVNMYARMLPGSLDRGVWVISPEVLPQLLTMTVGSGNAAVWIGGGNFPSGANRPPMTMLGAPLLVSEKAKQLGSPGDITFVDFNYYLIGDRQAMSARQSEDYKFQDDVSAFRWIERVDGRPWIESEITPQNGGDTLSPFVTAAN